MINILICDDDINYTTETKEFLIEHLVHSRFGELPINIECSNSSIDVFRRASNYQPDILLLDIHMPEKDGFAIAEAFHNNNPETKIIFLTNYEQFVFYSLRFSPFRFIRKHMIKKELPEAIDSALNSLSETARGLTIKRYSDYEIIPINNIRYIEKIKYRNIVEINCITGIIDHRETIQTLEHKLEGAGFVKINSGTIVNMKFVKQILGHELILIDGTMLKISNSRIDVLRKELSAYQRYDH